MGEETSQDPNIIAKLAIHQDRNISRTRQRERERDQTHSYWYIPSAPRENYSLLVMESIGMMKMATGEGLPPPAGCRNGSRLVFGRYRGFWRRNSQTILCFGSFRLRRYIWVQEVRQGSHEGPTRQGGAPQGGTPPPSEHLVSSLTWGPSPSGVFPSKNNFSN